MSLQALSDYTVYSRYAHYIPEKKRRETWSEIIDRVFGMHETKFQKELSENEEFANDFNHVKQLVKDKKVLGSQRALQFGGDGILKKNAKIYNCTSSIVDRPRVFQEIGYLLLCGCGAGYSVQYHHINKLPNIKRRTKGVKVYKPEDSIEGWAECWGILINSYFENGIYPEYEGFEVEFDLSGIRAEGELIAGQFKAPGPIPLENSLNKIKNLIDDSLDAENNKLTPLQAHDIICHIADSVISGGVRRSALIVLFSKEDKDMAECKTGNWFLDNPQRGRANNSVVLERGKITKEEFNEIFKNIKSFGEPGFYFVDDGMIHQTTNPCQPKWARLLTKEGIRKLEDVEIGDEIWSADGWTKIKNKWSTGIKKVYEYKTTAGIFYGTENHRLLSNGVKIEASECESIDVLSGEYSTDVELDPCVIMDGLVIGDGSHHRASNNLVILHIGEDDFDYFESEISGLIKKHRPGIRDTAYEITTSVAHQELDKTYNRVIPDRFLYGNKSTVCSFLRGLYSANGSVTGGRITFKTASSTIRDQVQMMLSSVGIQSYYTTNKPSSVKFNNGEYLCKISYDVNITSDRYKFYSLIGFIQKYKNEKLEKILENKITKGKTTFDIKEINFVSEEEVFDITVDNNSHTYWTQCCNVSNCCEIGFWPILETGESGFGGCNLTEINGSMCKTYDDFIEVCKAASFIGTLQAAYSDFPYLGKTTEEIFRRESLLGVSITGWMDNPKLLFDEKILKDGVAAVKEENIRIAKIIGINPAARTTCTKPSGSASCVLMTGSGIHGNHSKKYLRRAQVNKKEFAGKVMKKKNPISVTESVWSTNKTDNVISFPCEIPDGAIFKRDLTGVKFLERIKFAFEHWVLPGGNDTPTGLNPSVTHNISCTVNISNDDEWDDVREYIFENRNNFSGISLLAGSGDLDYDQAPFVEVLNPSELVDRYGDGVPLASGLIVDGLHCFDNLWLACGAIFNSSTDHIEEPIEPKKPIRKKYSNNNDYNNALSEYAIDLTKYYNKLGKFEKGEWIRRAKQFADRYFEGDLQRMTYCLKHVSIWKDWLDIKREWVDVEWETIKEGSQEYVDADTLASSACAGGQCSIEL